MKAKLGAFAFFSLLLAVTASPQTISEERVGQLALQFLPAPVRAEYAGQERLDELQNPIEQYHYSINPQEVLVGNFAYLTFEMPNDTARYVLLAWSDSFKDTFFFRLLKSADGGQSFAVAQDSPYWYGPLARSGGWRLWMSDLTADGVPELIMEAVDYPPMALVIFAWRNGGFVCITPSFRIDAGPSPGTFLSNFYSNGGAELMDADGDGIAEVVVSPWGERVADPDSTEQFPSFTWEKHTPTKIYKYNGTSYVLWKELPATDPYPVTIPSIAVIHPGTLPLAELSAPGNGDLQVLVSHPAGTNTVDDLVTDAFSHNGTALSFKKRWANNKQPDTASANWEWGGCPVKQTEPKGQGEWNPSPEDPFLPSPDGKTEYHFVAPYLEFRLPRSAVFPMLLQAATDAFAKDPARQTCFIEVPISGKMKNGKLAAAGAMVCIKKTGSAKATGPSPAPTVPPPAPPEKK